MGEEEWTKEASASEGFHLGQNQTIYLLGKLMGIVQFLLAIFPTQVMVLLLYEPSILVDIAL